MKGMGIQNGVFMSEQPRRRSSWRTFPLIGTLVAEWQTWREQQKQPRYRQAPMPDDASKAPPYPIDMWPLLALPFGTLDESGVPYNAQTQGYPATYQPTTIAQYALARWNVYLTTGDEEHRRAFMIQARWLVEHELRLADDAGGWPIPFPSYSYHTPESWLSALTQGNGISVLARAYRLTDNAIFLDVARRAVRTFELDIRDGGVSTSLGENGVFFEEVAVYPTAHILNGYILALFGLYDYVALTGAIQIDALIRRSLTTLHTLIDAFDTGYWTRYDLRSRHLSTPFYHALHVTLLEALAQYSGCEHCAALAKHWAGYKYSSSYYISTRLAQGRRKLLHTLSRGLITGENRMRTFYSEQPTHAFRGSDGLNPGSLNGRVTYEEN